MQTATISTTPEDYLTPEELAEARALYERLCARIRSNLSGRTRTRGAGAGQEHIEDVRRQITASRRPGTAPDAVVFELNREWRNLASLACKETTTSGDEADRLVELAGKMLAAYEATRAEALAAKSVDELLHTDSAGDRLYAAPPRGRHGTLIFIRPGEGEMFLPTGAVDALRAALNGDVAPAEVERTQQQVAAMDTFRAVLDAAGSTPADRAAVLNAAANVALSKQHAGHTPDDCVACAMAGVIEYDLRRMANAALSEMPTEPAHPEATGD